MVEIFRSADHKMTELVKVKSRPSKPRPTRPNPNKVPDYIQNNPDILKLIDESGLPKNYNFEIHKTIFRIRKLKCDKVALQMPEGLLLFACSLVNVFEAANEVLNDLPESPESEHGGLSLKTDFVILGNVAYGACCVDDFTAGAMECDLLVHYGHSCLVPIFVTDRCETVLYWLGQVFFLNIYIYQKNKSFITCYIMQNSHRKSNNNFSNY